MAGVGGGVSSASEVPTRADRTPLVLPLAEHAQAEVKAAYWAIFDTDQLTEGDDALTPAPELVAAVQARIDAFAEAYQATSPAAVKCLLTDREQLTSYLRFPLEHHRRIRHSNFIERTFGETRRRVKVISRLPGEASCLSLVWAVLDRASRGWRGLTMTPEGIRLLQELRHQLLPPPLIQPQHADTQPTTPKLSEPSHNLLHEREPPSIDLHRTWEVTRSR